MYPTAYDAHDVSQGYPSEGHPAPVPASGLPDHSHAHPFAPPYISTSLPRTDSALGQWTTGVCHCFDDPVNCFITCFCPCVTFGQTSEIVNRGYKSCASRGFLYGVLALTGLACFYSCFYRSKLRAQYDLPEEPCADCLVHFCCPGCALCQEYRELRNRGFDMSIGWEANMNRQKRGVTLAPAVVPAMSR
ncbi:hypothetical protein SLA2020_332210 [Shorea laevis]